MITDYEKRLAALGITNRGQLATGFEDGGAVIPFRESPLLDRAASTVAKPPPLTEDLSSLNPKNLEGHQRRIKAIWRKMSPEERKRRAKLNALAGAVGGKSTKGGVHRNY